MEPTLDVERLKAARESQGYAQAEIAKRAQMSAQQWNNIESGRKADPRVSTVKRMADALSVSVDSLLKTAAAQPLRKGRT